MNKGSSNIFASAYTDPQFVAGPGNMAIGAPILFANPNLFLYADNASNLYQDANAFRDSVTNDTYIIKPNGNLRYGIDIGDAFFGAGFDHSGVIFRNTTTNATGVFVTLDAGVLGGPPGTGGIISATDDGANLGTIHIQDPTTYGVNTSDAGTGESVSFGTTLGVGAFMNYTAGILSPYVLGVNVGGPYWDDGSGSFMYFPITPPNAGDVLSAPAGGGYGRMQWLPGGGGVTSFNTLTGAVTISAGANITLTPVGNDISIASSGGVSIGNPVAGGTPTEVLYIDNSGNLFSDSEFVRDSTNHHSMFISTSVETGYTTGMFFGSTYSVPNELIISHFDFLNNKGSLISQKSNHQRVSLTDASIAGTSLLGGIDIDYTSTPFVDVGLRDTGTANKSSAFTALLDYATMSHTYNFSGNLRNEIKIDANSWRFITDIPANNFVSLLFNFSSGVYSYGDVGNGVNGWATGLDIPNKKYLAGDIAGVGNGMVLYADDTLRKAAMGDPAAVKNNTAVIVDDSAQTVIGLGKIGASQTPGLYLDFVNTVFAYGDVGGVANRTVMSITDNLQLIKADTKNGGSTASMLHIDASSSSRVALGFNAGNAFSTGSAGTFIGYAAGQNVNSANDCTALGNNALATNTGGHSNTAIGTGALFTLDNGGISVAEYNTAVGRSAALNATTASYNVVIGASSGSTLTTGIDNVIIGYNANVSVGNAISRMALGMSAIATADYQVMVGGTGSPFNTFIIGAADRAASNNSTDVLFRINNQSGTDEAGKNLTIQSGISSGTGLGGYTYFKNSFKGIVSGTSLNTALNMGKIYNTSTGMHVVWGDVDNSIHSTKLHINDADKWSSFTNDFFFNVLDTSNQEGLLVDFTNHKFRLGPGTSGGSGRYVEVWDNAGTITLGGQGVVVTDGGHADQAVNYLAYGSTYLLATTAYDFQIGKTGSGATTIQLPTSGLANGLLGTTYILSDYKNSVSGGNTITVDAQSGNTIISPMNPGGSQTYAFQTDGEAITIKCIYASGGTFIWKIESSSLDSVGSIFTQTADQTIANTTTETTLFGSGSGSLTIPANALKVGRTVRLKIFGYHSSTANPSVTVNVKLGGTTIATGTGISGNGTNDGFYVDVLLTCRTTGASGSVSASGFYDELHASGEKLALIQSGTTTIDTTASNALDVTFTWGTAASGNTITSQVSTAELIN